MTTNYNNKKIPEEKMPSLKGTWWDHIEYFDDDGNLVKEEVTPEKNNAVVVTYPSLVSGLLANEPSFFGGILYHCLGSGLSSWDVSTPSPTFLETSLVNEVYRKAPTTITYQDENNDPVPSVDTARKILVKTVFEKTDAVGLKVRTQGLVGGNATSSLNTGLFIDIINHEVFTKTDKMKISRFIRLFFG